VLSLRSAEGAEAIYHDRVLRTTPEHLRGTWRFLDLTAPRLAELAALDGAGFRTMFTGSPIKRIGRDRFVRNVLIAIGNSGDPHLASVAAGLTADRNPVVAEAAAWACDRLAGAGT